MLLFTNVILFIVGATFCGLAGVVIHQIRHEAGSWKYKTLLLFFFLVISSMSMNMLLAPLSSVFGKIIHHPETATELTMITLYVGLVIWGYSFAKRRG